jgi:energy-coupling factor transporter transmembrane protein EcfT
LRFLADLMRLSPPMLFTLVRRGAAIAAALDMRGGSARQPAGRRVRLKFDMADAAALTCGLLIVGYAGLVGAEVMPPPHAALAPVHAEG